MSARHTQLGRGLAGQALCPLRSRHQARNGHRGRLEPAYSCTPRVNAPSATRLVPLTRLARGLARKNTQEAISAGVPLWPVGLSPTAVAKSSGFPVSMAAQTQPSK